jgi:RNA polymerase sigma factor (sigma-70 family)
MSVEHGGGSAADQRADDYRRDVGRHVRDTDLHAFAHLYESYAASLFDYCDELLQDTVAAADAVQDSLVAVDAHIGSAPEPDRLRLSLYSAARWQCLSQLTGGRPKLSGRAKTTTLDDIGVAVPEFEAAGTGGETVLVLRGALDWLADRDREVLSLTLRHRFGDADLAALLGTSSRRAQALLSEARTRFEQSASVVGVLRTALRNGRPGCSVLAGMVASRDLASLPLTPQLGKRLVRHLETCPDCALGRGDRAFTADQISEIPLAIPPGRLRLRITRTALALGSHRRPAGRPGRPGGPGRPGQGGPPAPERSRSNQGRHSGRNGAFS